jgi:hypothetical protein
MNRAAIEQYAAGADQPLKGIAGLSREDLQAFPIPGTWSIQQIIIHLMDSDLIASDRMKRIAAEEKPLLIGYSQDAFMTKLHPDKMDATMAAEVFRLNRLLTADVLRLLPDEAFAKVGVHNERGLLSLEQLVTGYVGHLDGHMGHLRRKRDLLGKPMK